MIWIIPFLAGLIGWLTNFLAIKMLFRPRIKRFGIQGLIPKRKAAIAKRIGKVVEDDLISVSDIVSNHEEDIVHKVKSSLRTKFSFVYNILPEELCSDLENNITLEIMKAIKDPSLIKSISISKIVEDKVNEFNIDELENTVISLAKTELRMIEILGAVIGFLVGIIQITILK